MEDVLNFISTLSLNILSFYVKIKFHTENEPPSLLDYGNFPQVLTYQLEFLNFNGVVQSHN